MISAGLAVALIATGMAAQAAAQTAAPAAASSRLPEPERDPLRIDRAADPILSLGRTSVPSEEFRRLVAQAVQASPELAESRAGVAEARAARNEAKAGRYPVVDVGLNATQAIWRNFNDDIDVIVERARGKSRVDATLNAEQTLYDFGATESRVAAAGARLRAAALDTEAEASSVALRSIAAWYDVFAYRALVQLAEAFVASQTELRQAISERIRLGVSAPGDLPRVESYIASAQADLAQYRRSAANAEARFQELFGAPPPPGLGRAPILPTANVSREAAVAMAAASPAVESAQAAARGARQDARAQRASGMPRVSAGVDAGRYGLFEDNNYDVRGRLTVRQRLFGGVASRVEQYDARADASQARADRVRREAEREAAIAWEDVEALKQQLSALENSYVASRQSRDVLAERFRVARGTLFDLLESESGYFSVSATYIRGITELDAARYVLLTRTGRLLETLGIEPPVREDP